MSMRCCHLTLIMKQSYCRRHLLHSAFPLHPLATQDALQMRLLQFLSPAFLISVATGAVFPPSWTEFSSSVRHFSLWAGVRFWACFSIFGFTYIVEPLVADNLLRGISYDHTSIVPNQLIFVMVDPFPTRL